MVPGTNTGFAGGCNRGIAALPADVELVALLNSDAVPLPGWLAPLAAALDETRASARWCRRRASTVASTISRSSPTTRGDRDAATGGSSRGSPSTSTSPARTSPHDVPAGGGVLGTRSWGFRIPSHAA